MVLYLCKEPGILCQPFFFLTEGVDFGVTIAWCMFNIMKSMCSLLVCCCEEQKVTESINAMVGRKNQLNTCNAQ